MGAPATILRNSIATAYGGLIAAISLHSIDPTATSGTTGELTGGSPVYVRVAPPTIASPASPGTITFQVTLNVAAGSTVGGAGLWDSSGNFLQGGVLTAVSFGSQGTYLLTVTYVYSGS